MNRTHGYMYEVFTQENPHPVADRLVETCPALIGTSGCTPGRAFVRFRAHDDGEAMSIIAHMQHSDDTETRLTTGYGVHQREVPLEGGVYSS